MHILAEMKGNCQVVDTNWGETSVASARAEAVEYVDTLLARAKRFHVPEADVRQALKFFDEAKQANLKQDYKAASSYFEASFLLNPKLTTLISTANM